MKIQKMILLGCRVTSDALINALNVAIAQPHEKQWAVLFDEASHQVTIACYRKKAGKMEILPGVQLKVVEQISPDSMFNHITVELVVEGLLNNIIAARKILTDFEKIKTEIVEALSVYRGKRFRVYEHGTPQPAAN